MKIKRKCNQCGIEFEANHWDVARNRGKFCGRECVTESMIKAAREKRLKQRGLAVKEDNN